MDNTKSYTTTTTDILKSELAPPKFFEPCVTDNGIYVPYAYNQRLGQMLILKELFIEAYNKWIKEDDK